MSIEFEIASIDPEPLVDALQKEGIAFSLAKRQGFDGIAVATLVVNAVAALGGIATPIILHLLKNSKSDDAEVTINGITVGGLDEDQVRRIFDDLVSSQSPKGGN
jgi:hypothetical protein